jgi:glucose-6-phosphate dehydrogenase assembly protein OpcA
VKADLLPSGRVVPFAEASAVLARNQARSLAASLHRALTATMVVVGPGDRLPEAADAARELGDRLGVRVILISLGSDPSPLVQVDGCTIALAGLKSEYVNNAVAALRLSSLPTLVWWRGGAPAMLDGLVDLAERVVLDEQTSPEETWRRACALFKRASFSDLRWTRLTRWRALMAHFFDVPAVRDAIPSFTHLRVCGTDRVSAVLFAGWLRSSLRPDSPFQVDISESAGEAPIEEIQLTGPGLALTLRLAGSHTCVEAAAEGPAAHATSRIVTLGDQRLSALLADELKVRARDAAFERAVQSVVQP